MDWGSALITIYLLGMLGAAAVFARPIKRVMGIDTRSAHVDPSSAREADVIVVATVTGVAALWPLTLSVYVASRFVPASTEYQDDAATLEYMLVQQHGNPE